MEMEARRQGLDEKPIEVKDNKHRQSDAGWEWR